MHVNFLKSGFKEFDNFIDGGIENEEIFTIYGAPASGKTNLCTIFANSILKQNLIDKQSNKVIYIDAEQGFSIKRLKQISQISDTNLFSKFVENLILIKPKTFEEQTECIANLNNSNLNNTKAIIIDSISMMYRFELKDKGTDSMQNELAKQLGLLSQISKQYKVPIIIVAQVYQSLKQKEHLVMLGGDLLKYSSKTILECKRFNERFLYKLKKHPSKKINLELEYIIVNEGIKTK